MSQQGQLKCPSCDNSFEPTSNGGFCPDCDTPHPDFDHDGDVDTEEDGTESADGGAHAEEEAAESVNEDADAGEETAGEETAGEVSSSSEADTETSSDSGDEFDAATLVVNGERYRFDDGDTFGRRSDCWLDDLIEAAGGKDEVVYISGEHLKFSIEEETAYVEDVSRNGTALNGTLLKGDRAEIEDGDSITLAKRAELQVEL
jgi:hypothetical protein